MKRSPNVLAKSFTDDQVAEIAIDIWKISFRARSESTSDRVLAACDRAQDRLQRLGLTLEDPAGRPYDTSLKARVIDHDEAEGPIMIAQCVSPAVYVDGILIREAEIITRGEK